MSASKSAKSASWTRLLNEYLGLLQASGLRTGGILAQSTVFSTGCINPAALSYFMERYARRRHRDYSSADDIAQALGPKGVLPLIVEPATCFPSARSATMSESCDFLLDILVSDLENSVHMGARAGWEAVFIAEFPTGTFNASTMLPEPGAMILVDSGLVKILFYLTTIVFLVRVHLLPIAAAVTILTDVTRLYTLHPREAFAPSTWHPTHERRRKEIASLLDQADVNDRLYALSPLLWYSLKFTVCHEYGHLLLGHLTSDKKTLRLRPASQVTRAPMHPYEPWNRELQADSVAMDLLIKGDNPVEPSVKMARFMGPMLLFHAWHMIEQVQMANSSDEAGSTHPPTELRMESIRSGIGRELGPYEGERALGLDIDLSALGQLVASSLAEDSGK